MKRIFGLLVIGCVLYACSPILKYGKFHRYVWYDVGGGTNWTGKWSRIGNTLYAEQTMDSLTLMDSIDSIILLELMQLPYRDTFIIKKNRLMRETQKFKWREKGEHMYKDYKGSKTRTKYKFVPAEN